MCHGVDIYQSEQDEGSPMTLKAILFDKDGTLLDFDKTWGEAGYSVMRHMTSGDEDAFNRLVALTHYKIGRAHV